MAGLEEAIALAVTVHRGQLDKAGAPYILHPLRLMFAVEGEAARMAAVLHDVVEDGPHASLDELRAMGFPGEVVAAVDALSRRSGESYEAFIVRAGANPIARRVKLADLADNMNLLRLTDPGPRDWERLAKYRRAWEVLSARESP